MGYCGVIKRVPNNYFDTTDRTIKETVDVDKYWEVIPRIFGGGYHSGPTSNLFIGKSEVESIRYHDEDYVQLIHNYIYDINDSNVTQLVIDNVGRMQFHELPTLSQMALDIVELFKNAVAEDDIVLTTLE